MKGETRVTGRRFTLKFVPYTLRQRAKIWLWNVWWAMQERPSRNNIVYVEVFPGTKEYDEADMLETQYCVYEGTFGNDLELPVEEE
jgi:hypothetical protein